MNICLTRTQSSGCGLACEVLSKQYFIKETTSDSSETFNELSSASVLMVQLAVFVLDYILANPVAPGKSGI